MRKIKINHKTWMVVIGLITISLIGFVEKKHSDTVCLAINISIDSEPGQYFIDDLDVINIITNDGDDIIVGEYLSQINLKELERRLTSQAFIHNAEVHTDLRGNLNVNVYQTRPIARITHSGYNDKYINEMGAIIPTSKKYTARVMLISGYVSKNIAEQNLYENEYGTKLMQLIQYINKNDFWRSMIAQIDIDAKGNIFLYPQVGKQFIEFGQPEEIESKFKKAFLLYDKILPSKGWNEYERVSVKFKNQIVCE